MKIIFSQFHFILNPIGRIYLPPYKGSTLRGAFGNIFKKIVCINKKNNCNQCLLQSKCIYSYVFETPSSPDSLKMKKYPYVPHPFIITPPLEERKEYKNDDEICFQLILVGKCIDFLPYFIYTFEEIGKIGIGKERGKFQLKKVKALHPNESEKTIYSGQDKILYSNFRTIQINDLTSFHPSPSCLHLKFLTPIRLKYNERLVHYLEFHIFLRNLLRRISLLAYFHCGQEMNIDFRGLIEEAKKIKVINSDLKWFDLERYSNRQTTKMKIGGLIGEIIFEGNFIPFMPYILLGEYFHVGKGTSFGLGKYKILRSGY